MPNIEIDSESIRAVVAKGLLDSLTTEAREVMVASAIEYLLTEQSDGYGRTKEGSSPIHNAFRIAVGEVARDVVRDLVHSEDLKGKITAAIEQKVLSILTELSWEADIIGSAVGDAVAKVLRGES